MMNMYAKMKCRSQRPSDRNNNQGVIAMSFTKKIISTKNAPSAIGPYSQSVVATGSLVFVSGQIPIDPTTGSIVSGDIAAQARQSLKNVKAILDEAGASLENVVKTTVFLSDMDDFATMNSVYTEFFTHDCPARSAIQVARLPKDVKVEVEAIAVV